MAMKGRDGNRGSASSAVSSREKSLTLDVGDRAIPLRLVRNRRARRLILRIDPRSGGATVTLPPWAGWAEAADLAVRETDWIRDRLNTMPRPVPFVDGGTFPYLGECLMIRHVADRGPPVRRLEEIVEVRGDAAHLPRRLTDWLRTQARAEIEQRARTKADRLDKTIEGITIRDTRTRWGSCSAKGVLSFSWRLIMAPEAVLDYVVAHEVAHLRHHNHSSEFWQTAAELTGDMAAPRAWLRQHGPALHLYG